jgi:hypothetical protein
MTKRRSDLQCTEIIRAWMVDNGMPTSPQKPAGQQPEPNEEYWPCPRHPDMKDGAGPLHASLKANHIKNEFFCGPCGGGGGPWSLVAFLLGKGYRWEALSKADQKEVTAWILERGLLPEKPRRSREAGKKSYPILREHIYRDWNSGKPIARRIRYDVPSEEKQNRFAWSHSESGGAARRLEWRPGLSNVNGLPLYVGVPAPKDEETFLRCLARFKSSVEVALTEGEHDADAGAEVGLAAVTGGGTSSLEILRRNVEHFRGKDVVIVAHPGAKELQFAEEAASTLYGIAKRVKIVKPSEFWPGDVKDLADIVEGMAAGGYGAETVLTAFGTARDKAAEWKPETGAEILDQTYAAFDEFINVPPSALCAFTLWAANTYAYDLWRHAPLLHIYSPEPNCGKTTALKILLYVSRDADYTESPTESSCFRLIAQEHPTMLLDEMDTIFTGKVETDKAMQRLLNSVFERGSKYNRTEQEGKRWVVNHYDVFSPVAFATVRSEIVPASTRSRTIPINMQRLRGKPRFGEREREINRLRTVGAKLGAWVASVREKLRQADPNTPDFAIGRQLDVASPLLAIAQEAGGRWPEFAMDSLFSQLAGDTARQSTSAQLLRDIRKVFFPVNDDGTPEEPRQRIASVDVACALGRMQDTIWATYGGKTCCKRCGLHHITPSQIKRLLSDYQDAQGQRIEPRDLRIEGKVTKGYEQTQFEAAWKAYLEATLPHQSNISGNANPRVSNINEPALPCCLETADGLYDNSINSGAKPLETQPVKAEKPYKIVKMSEWRSKLKAAWHWKRYCPISFLDSGPRTWASLRRMGASLRGTGASMRAMGKAIVNGRETAMLDMTSLESRPASIDHTERATANMTGLEKRRK